MVKKTHKDNQGQEEESSKNSEQEKYMELQLANQQAMQLQKYLQAFDQQLLEIKNVINAIKEFGNLKKGDSIFAPIANGVFVKAKLEDPKELRINVGNNVVATKSVAEAVALLEAQEKEIKDYRSETLVNMESVMQKLESLQSE